MQMFERSQSLFQYYNNITNCKMGILLTMHPTLHYKMNADEACDGSGDGCKPDVMDLAPRLQTRRH